MANSICCWLTGPQGAGKRTIAHALVEELRRRGRPAAVIDDPTVDRVLAGEDRTGAVIWLAGLLVDCDAIAVVAIEAPQREVRERARAELPGFAEIFVDPGPRRLARADEDDYEEPYGPELHVPTHDRDATASTAQVVSWLETSEIL